MLEALVVAVSVKAAEKFSEKAAEALISALVESQNEQRILLERIDRNVQQLIQGPFNAGIVRLREALVPYRTPQQRAELITKAKDSFYDAYGQEHAPLRRSLISLNIGICWLALGSLHDARSWIAEAHKLSRPAAEQVVDAANQRNLAFYLDAMNIDMQRRRAPVDRMQEYLWSLKELRLSLGEAPESIYWYSIFRGLKGDSRVYEFIDDRPIGLL